MDEIDGLRKQLEELKLQNKQKDEELSSARTENSKLQQFIDGQSKLL